MLPLTTYSLHISLFTSTSQLRKHGGYATILSTRIHFPCVGTKQKEKQIAVNISQPNNVIYLHVYNNMFCFFMYYIVKVNIKYDVIIMTDLMKEIEDTEFIFFLEITI